MMKWYKPSDGSAVSFGGVGAGIGVVLPAKSFSNHHHLCQRLAILHPLFNGLR